MGDMGERYLLNLNKFHKSIATTRIREAHILASIKNIFDRIIFLYYLKCPKYLCTNEIRKALIF